jgi:hypothetical protein
VEVTELKWGVKKYAIEIRQGNLLRQEQWAGVSSGEPVIVDGVKERRQSWVFIAHVLNSATNEEWVEVRGGKAGESKTRSFRPELIYPMIAKKGSKLVGLPLSVAPQLPIY